MLMVCVCACVCVNTISVPGGEQEQTCANCFLGFICPWGRDCAGVFFSLLDWLQWTVWATLLSPFNTVFWTLHTAWWNVSALLETTALCLRDIALGENICAADSGQDHQQWVDHDPDPTVLTKHALRHFVSIILRLVENPLQLVATALFFVYFPEEATALNYTSLGFTLAVVLHACVTLPRDVRLFREAFREAYESQ